MSRNRGPGARELREAKAKPAIDIDGRSSDAEEGSRTQSGSPAASSTPVKFLLEESGLQPPDEPEQSPRGWQELSAETFHDRRWQHAIDHLRERGLDGDALGVQALLRQGARTFGFWNLSEAALEPLARHVFAATGAGGPAGPSPGPSRALQARLDSRHANMSDRLRRPPQLPPRDAEIGGLACRRTSITQQHVQDSKKQNHAFGHGNDGLQAQRTYRLKVVLTIVLTAVSVCIVVPWPGQEMPTDTSRHMMGPSESTLEMFGWLLVVARAGGVGSLLWTALLFLSMSRTMLKKLYRWLPGGLLVGRYLDTHESVHAFCGKMLAVNGVAHTAAHLLSTYPVMSGRSYKALNRVLECAQPGATVGVVGKVLLPWPSCPLVRDRANLEAIFTAPGVTGFGLIAVLGAMGYTAAKMRRSNYELFWYVHNVGLVLWILLLFLHGTQGWFGFAIPLVVPVCGVPLCLYAVDRVLRLLRYYLYGGRSGRILSAVIRPGKEGDVHGSLTALQVSKPPRLWSFRPGMYAYLCLPEYSSWQWHPFTIVSHKKDESVDFIVAGVGDWTKALAQRCLDVRNGLQMAFPRVALDGPYAAPVTGALSCEILVVVGAGVGITPSLALLASFVATLEEDGEGDDAASKLPLEEAHFYWMTRSADEFLFARRHFERIVSNSWLLTKLHLHLHLTQKEPEADAPAFLFREAVRRQSQLDRTGFSAAMVALQAKELKHGPQLPWCWVNGHLEADVLWVGGLVETTDEQEEELLDGCAEHWGRSSVARSSIGRGLEGPVLLRNGGDARVVALRSPPPPPSPKGLASMLPITFGRPEFATEIQALGKAHPEHNVHVYACGNGALVESLRNVCQACTERAAGDAAGPKPQEYILRCENFNGE